MVKVNWTDGAALSVAVGIPGVPGARDLKTRLDLSDDRSFLSDSHRDLAETLPNLSVHPGQAPGQGWIRASLGGVSVELHVLLQVLPPDVDLVLGRRAAELLSADPAG